MNTKDSTKYERCGGGDGSMTEANSYPTLMGYYLPEKFGTRIPADDFLQFSDGRECVAGDYRLLQQYGRKHGIAYPEINNISRRCQEAMDVEEEARVKLSHISHRKEVLKAEIEAAFLPLTGYYDGNCHCCPKKLSLLRSFLKAKEWDQLYTILELSVKTKTIEELAKEFEAYIASHEGG